MGKMRDEFIRLSETPIMDKCRDCYGEGFVEVEYAVPHNINRDVGYLETRSEECETCNGDGKVERLCTECEEWVTLIRGDDAYICADCAESL
jgi:hypothetical protein